MRNRWLAGDGLPARPSGQWTQEKLGYVERYARAFMLAMHPKRREGKWEQLVYIDLLAGLGKGIAFEDLVSLPRYESYLRLMVDYVVTRGFSAETLPPSGSSTRRQRGRYA